MYSIHNRDDLEKLKKLQASKSLIKAERLKQLLGKQDFHYDMEEVFEPVTVKQAEATKNQKQLSEKQIQSINQQTQAVRDSSQTTVQAIENQTQAIRESSNTLNKNLQKSIKEYDEITNRNNQLVTNLVNSNRVDSSIVKIVSNLLNTESRFKLQPVEGYPNLFTINPSNPQQVLIKGSTITFQNGNTYNLNDPDLSYFITNTRLDKEIQNYDIIYNFLNDMKYDLYYGDKKSTRYNLIKFLINKYNKAGFTNQDIYQQSGSGLNQYTRVSDPSKSSICIFLPSDPNELVDQLKLLYFEKVGGNDNPILSEQIIAIADKLLQYQCITTNQHQNLVSTFTKKDQFVD